MAKNGATDGGNMQQKIARGKFGHVREFQVLASTKHWIYKNGTQSTVLG